jgi:ABC-type Fe3+/spermidine/putrescine transport system ATPase subunit
MAGASIELRSAGRVLGGRRVLAEISLEIAAGEAIALIGPSGAGKTTLLRLVAGLERPDSGMVLLDGRDAAPVRPRDRRIGMVFQDLALWPYLTVEEHLREVARGPVETLLDRFGLTGMGGKRPHLLSGGERQRLAIARALAGEPRILLLDEPFTNLDPLLRRQLSEALAEIQRERGLTSVYVSHYFDQPVARAARVALLREGRIEQVGTLSELRSGPANEWVAAFLAEEAIEA